MAFATYQELKKRDAAPRTCSQATSPPSGGVAGALEAGVVAATFCFGFSVELLSLSRFSAMIRALDAKISHLAPMCSEVILNE